MRKNAPSEKRAKVESGFTGKHEVPFRIPRALAWLIVMGGACLTGLADFLTPAHIWLGPVYLIFIGLASWTLGWCEGLAILAISMALAFQANGGTLYPSTHPTTWQDVLVRIVPIAALIALLGYSRHFAEREWRLARTDPLTGALNRKAFFELAGSIAQSKGWHLLAYADLDGLKRLNDRQGHARGDQSLIAFTRKVRSAIRRRDLFARVGGDEFLVYLAVRDAKAGLEVARRLHRAMNPEGGDLPDELRCSVGALILAPGPRSIDRELRAADELMYEAKQCGGALTVATAREHGDSLSTAGRWMLTPVMNGAVAVPSDFKVSERPGGKAAA